MPQLDIFSYESKVFFLVCVFSLVYFSLLKGALPKIFKILRFRQYIKVRLRLDIVQLEKERFYVTFVKGKYLVSFVQQLNEMPGVALKVLEDELVVERSDLQFVLGNLKDEMNMFVDDDLLCDDLICCAVLDLNEFLEGKDKYDFSKKIFMK